MRRSQHGHPKRQGGISLIPELWEAIDSAAKLAGVSRNQVMEVALMERFGVPVGARKTAYIARKTEGTPDLKDIDDDD